MRAGHLTRVLSRLLLVVVTAGSVVVTTSSGPAVAVPPGTVTTIDVADLPPDATAVFANVAMADATAEGYVTADRCSALTAGPQARASGNHGAGGPPVSNLAVVPVDPAAGESPAQFCVYNQSPVELVVDLQAAVTPTGDRLVPVTPRRVLDTRSVAALRTPDAVTVVDTGITGASGVLVNIAMVDAATVGYVRADRCDLLAAGGEPRATGNHPAGLGAVSNLAMVAVDPTGRFCIYHQATVHLVVDLQAVFAATGPSADSVAAQLGDEATPMGITSIPSSRLVDTRAAGAPTPAAGTVTVVETGAPPGTSAAVVNLAFVGGETAGYVTADRCDTLVPGPQQWSNGNHPAGPGAVSNLAVVPLDTDGRFCVFRQSTVHLVVDVQAWLGADHTDGITLLPARRLVDTRPPRPPSIPGVTSCESVVHIGDSTSVGMIHPQIIPDVGQRLPAQYQRVGVDRPIMEISGARSIVETLRNQENAYDVARRIKAAGYEGCWVLALGTTDTANIAAGSGPGRAWRIDRMMSVIGDDPVLWVNTRTIVASGPWSNNSMLLWNNALAEAPLRHPNIKIYDWASVVQRGWFSGDGVHYTPEGYRIRGALIADALAVAWPS